MSHLPAVIPLCQCFRDGGRGSPFCFCVFVFFLLCFVLITQKQWGEKEPSEEWGWSGSGEGELGGRLLISTPSRCCCWRYGTISLASHLGFDESWLESGVCGEADKWFLLLSDKALALE